MSNKFQKGDRVQGVLTKRIGTVTAIDEYNVDVSFDNGDRSTINWRNLTLIERASVVDHTKPIIALIDGGPCTRPYNVQGIFTRYPGGEELIVVLSSVPGATREPLHVDPRTGKVVPQFEGDRRGLLLTFSNVPVVTTGRYDVQVSGINKRLTLDVTMTDGEVTAVEWVK